VMTDFAQRAELHLSAGHDLAQLAGDLVGHEEVPTRPLRGHPPLRGGMSYPRLG
jgi:hypothetical protein